MRLQHLIDLLQNLGDPQVRRFVNRRFEITPESRQHVLPLKLTAGDVVELVFHLGCEVVANIAAEVVFEKGDHKPPFILRK